MTVRWMGCILLASVGLCAVAAGESPESTLSVQGSASIEKMPVVMRLRVDIPASGSDVGKALARLKEKREAAVKKLQEIGTPAEGIKTDPPTFSLNTAEAARQRMLKMRGQAEEEEEEAKPAKVDVTCAVSAEWPLKSEDPEAMLVEVHALQQKVRSADLAGLKDDKPTEEELEEQAEMEEQMSRWNDDGPKPGEPTFLFAWKLTEAERAKLLADAFAAAKADAQRLAAAANVELGSLASLSSHTAGGDEYDYTYRQALYQAMGGARIMVTPETMENEAVGILPQKISKRVVVMAAYRFK